MTFDYYATLGVSPNAEPEVIRAAYRAMAQKHHPDRNNQSREAHEITARLNEAYEVLSDPAQRRNYDAQRSSEESADQQSFYKDKLKDSPSVVAEAMGHAFTLRFIPGQIVSNETWNETRGGGTFFSGLPFGPKVEAEDIPQQRIGVRTMDGDLIVQQTGSHIPLAFDDRIEIVQVLAEASEREGIVAITNLSTGQWFWIGSQLEAGRLFRTARVVLIDFAIYFGVVALLLVAFWTLIVRSSDFIVSALYLCVGVPMLFKVATPMLTFTGNTLGLAVRDKIRGIVEARFS